MYMINIKLLLIKINVIYNKISIKLILISFVKLFNLHMQTCVHTYCFRKDTHVLHSKGVHVLDINTLSRLLSLFINIIVRE